MPTESGTLDASYAYWQEIQTRWADNDGYGHVNSAHYYSYFDSALTRWLLSVAGLDPHHGEFIGLTVESHCEFRAPIAFPQDVAVGLRAGRVGTSSVCYEFVLADGLRRMPAALGRQVHVYVDTHARRPIPIPASFRGALTALRVEASVGDSR
jgi:acyl-CoA thioester hydrolase